MGVLAGVAELTVLIPLVVVLQCVRARASVRRGAGAD